MSEQSDLNHIATFKVGDIIATYHKGFYELININGYIFEYKLRYDSNGKPKNDEVIYQCCSNFCRHAHELIEEQLTKMELAKKQLTTLKNSIPKP